MKLLALIPVLVAFVVGTLASPAPRNLHSQVSKVVQNAARAPFPIPTLAHIDHAELAKRENQADTELYLFGGFHATKSGDTLKLEAAFNKTAGASWCNSLKDTKDNRILSAHVDSHKGWHDPNKPKEYVCFFYESQEHCDPSKGKAEYVESDPANRDIDTQFGDDTKYIHWGCMWHPENLKEKGGTGW